MIFRDARRDELARIVALLADDELGAGRETGVDDAYQSAFDDIAADPRSRLIVADVDGQVAGTLQLTVLPGLALTEKLLNEKVAGTPFVETSSTP